MTDDAGLTKPEPRPRGLSCARCRGALRVYRTTAPAPGLIVRYRKCSACGENTVTEERERVPEADGQVHV